MFEIFGNFRLIFGWCSDVLWSDVLLNSSEIFEKVRLIVTVGKCSYAVRIRLSSKAFGWTSTNFEFLVWPSVAFKCVPTKFGYLRCNRPRSISITILTWLPGFQDKRLYLVLFSLYPSLFWQLRDKRNLKNLQFWSLLSNCSEYRPNNSTNIQRYCTVICTVENLFAGQVCARTQNCHTLPLSLINLLTSSS